MQEKKMKSTVPGMIYPSGRDHFMRTPFGFIEGRRKDDGAEGLWRINDNLYDLETFIKNHPGGSEWLTMTRGTDITEAFECHHITDKAEKLLPKFLVRKAEAPRSLGYTFAPDGFYRKFKARVGEALKDVDFHHGTTESKLIIDVIASLTVLSAVAVALTKSWILIAACALFLAWTTIIAHNFFHLRDNFRMYYFDLSLMSSKEWRISHVLSHHLYPNTLWDMEVYSFEPFLMYLPNNKSLIDGLRGLLISPLVFSLGFIGSAVKRYYSLYKEWKMVEFRDFVPFILPVSMSFFASSPFEAIKLWLCVILLSSFIFQLIGLSAAHHHPDIFHDGDIPRKDSVDWGIMELDAVRDRKVIDDSLFLVLTNFGSHGLHHLLPTVDHAHLALCLPAFEETCREFGIDTSKLTSWELVKGQYQQLVRNEPKLNIRGKADCDTSST